jgi:predicted DNA-binding antitoxin AbrB/MazE fold protein
LEEGEEVEIEVKKNIAERTFGLIQLDSEVIDEIIEDTKYGPA